MAFSQCWSAVPDLSFARVSDSQAVLKSGRLKVVQSPYLQWEPKRPDTWVTVARLIKGEVKVGSVLYGIMCLCYLISLSITLMDWSYLYPTFATLGGRLKVANSIFKNNKNKTIQNSLKIFLT